MFSQKGINMIHSWKVFVAVAVLLAGLLCGCQTNKVGGKVDVREEQGKIPKVIDTYVQAVEAADADLMESLFWKDDPYFSEIENDRPKPFGGKTFTAIGDWMRKHGEPGNKQRFYETTVHILSPEVAYSVSMRDEYEGEKAIPSRVTLIYLKKGDEWRIIHGHFSYVPE